MGKFIVMLGIIGSDILTRAKAFLLNWVPGKIPERVCEALDAAPEMRYRGIVGSSQWMPLGTARKRKSLTEDIPNLLGCFIPYPKFD